ncbi:MAG TPA: dienelactone hydrolase family protein [Solirubrobacteraceae bacterium]|nr:dienelactone hydrolase family protein [Solirubrobacteraceae bacterium]
MSGDRLEITTADGVADAYRARPDGEVRGSVLLIMDAYGLRPQIERMADRIAERGYVVLAPNVFYRDAKGLLLTPEELAGGNVFEKVMPLVRALTPDVVVRDGPAYLNALGDGPVAITGYCMGGRAGWHLAAAYPDRVAALGGFHVGSLVTDAPDSPHHKAPDIAAEVYFGHADNDRSMNPDQIATLDAAMDEAGVVHRTEVYEGAAHGYTMADTPAYDEAAAERHYRELFALLDRTVAA